MLNEEKSVYQIVKDLKDNNQDYEFYPTTDEMLECIRPHFPNLYRVVKVLDIGCGTCKFKTFFNDKTFKYYVIEKSKILIETFDEDTICIGTDFNSNSLLDKPVDLIFCNPPYSEFTNWVHKIIIEGNFTQAFLIIPQRWKENKETHRLLEKYKTGYEVLGSFDFLDGERKARAKVDVVKLLKQSSNHEETFNETSFNEFFKDNFGVDSSQKDLHSYEQNDNLNKKYDVILSELQGNKIEFLVNDYNEQYNKLFKNLELILSLDEDVLKDFGFSVFQVKEGLKLRLINMKRFYWKRVINELSEITDKLTYDTRNELFRDFDDLWNTDFTLDNIYALAMWIVKNANKHYNNQIIDFFKKLSSYENVKPYKSNVRLFEKDGWSWRSQDKDNYYLDYRIIMGSMFYHSIYDNTISTSQESFNRLNDMTIIAENLGFSVKRSEIQQDVNEYGKKYYIHLDNGDIFMEFKVYKNRNIHVKFNTEFTKALNVTVGKLLGWLRCKEDIKEQLPTEMAKGAEKYFDRILTIDLKQISNLLPFKNETNI